MHVTKNYEDEWLNPTPVLAPDHAGGTLLILQIPTVCPDCGGLAVQRFSCVWRGTLRPDLRKLGYGASVKHYFTKCADCGSQIVG